MENKGDEFRWKKNSKIGGEKMRSASGQQVENEQQWLKKCEQEHKQKKTFGQHIQHFLHKMSN